MSQKQTALAVVASHTNELNALAAIHGHSPAAVLAELSHLEIISMGLPDLAQADPRTIVQGVKTVLGWNLSLNPDAGLVYVTTRNKNIGTKNSANYVTVMEVQRTANGYISTALQTSSILDFERPTVRKNDKGRVTSVIFRYLKPSYPGPRWEEVEYDESDFARWKAVSERQNKGSANALYTSFNSGIDPEFARSKAIRHTLKKIGTNHNAPRGMSQPVPFTPVVDISTAINDVAEEVQDGGGEHFKVTTHEVVTIASDVDANAEEAAAVELPQNTKITPLNQIKL